MQDVFAAQPFICFKSSFSPQMQMFSILGLGKLAEISTIRVFSNIPVFTLDADKRMNVAELTKNKPATWCYG